MSDGPIDRIRSELGDGVVERLVDLPGTDLTSLLLHVMARRSEDAGAGELKRRYREDRFVGPGAANLRSLHETEAILLDAVPAHFDAIVLSPVAPSGIHPFVRVHQNNVISTVRRTDVAADPTTGLALEAVARRESGAGDVHVVSIQRVTRAQRFSGPLSFAHFTLLGMVSVGRGHRFGLATLTEHAAVQARAIMSAGADAVVVSLSDWDSAFPEWAESVVAAVEDARVEVVEASDRVRARGYYEGAAFEVSARFGETQIDVGDGGVVDWASRMLGDGNERMVISGIGVDRLALVRSG